jgi:GrpB-like predicted nucleotidyltransferase (UPF0157 family)
MKLGLRRGDVRLCRHQRGWRKAFEDESAALRAVLGRGAIRIEHVGSTAVPGLPAKPVIDVAVGVRALGRLPRWPVGLRAAGYAYLGDREGRGEHFYAKGPEAMRTFYLHVVPIRSRNWADYLAFRDALRKNPPLRRRYGQLKIRLSRAHPHDRETYTQGKATFIHEVLDARHDPHPRTSKAGLSGDSPAPSMKPAIVAGGPLASWGCEYATIERRLLAEARLRRAQELKKASLLGRARLELAIRREVSAQMRRKFPFGALYGAAGRRAR